MGRPAKPISVQSGHRTNKALQLRETAEGAIDVCRERIESPPDYLNKEAAKEWENIVSLQRKLGTLNDLDYNALSRYCTLVIQMRDLERMANKSKKMDPETLAAVIDTIRKASPELTKLEHRLNMTFQERLKAATSKVEQEEQRLELQFGAI